MKLNEIIENEEKLLILNDKYKHLLTFSEVIRLKRYMTEVGDITNLYFELVEEYHAHVPKEGKKTDELINKIYEYNDTLLGSDVESDLLNMNEIVGFINLIASKYSIVFPNQTETIEN
jgi:hypothetical protein